MLTVQPSPEVTVDETELKKAKDQLGHARLLWFIHKVQSYGFWAIILLGAGIALGILYADSESVKNTNNQILVGSFIHKGVVYEITTRAIQPAPLPTTDTKGYPITDNQSSTKSSGAIVEQPTTSTTAVKTKKKSE